MAHRTPVAEPTPRTTCPHCGSRACWLVPVAWCRHTNTAREQPPARPGVRPLLIRPSAKEPAA